MKVWEDNTETNLWLVKLPDRFTPDSCALLVASIAPPNLPTRPFLILEDFRRQFPPNQLSLCRAIAKRIGGLSMLEVRS